ncbi:SGNH/GDSL hydrolase family protein [Arthrobacter sp. PAMC25564]|uniref:SGNH/GDSL hydrolase family protein n=1 Tax=Arthrobacter sp. PAMC25564 TaxID=2565366 RepID=UPI0010A27891|nr:SGNH/GDSL hydrolase family protein [Arthrobacter sp. PAMC25564]QCB95836.1 SGNH/GDSL hydrolase family protein [Arthrobacter sp. PAMC25564]
MNAASFKPGAGSTGNTGPTPGSWSRYVAMGDSFTAGLGDPEPLSPGGIRGWADRTAEELSARRDDFAYANLAINGLLLRQILDQQLGPALELKPDLVTLSAGGNDLVFHRSDPDRLAVALDAAVRQLAATGATVVLFTGPDWGETPLLGHTRGKVAVFNENIRTIAARHNGIIADLWTLRQLAHPQMWDPDRLHFSPLGHHTIATMVLDTLNVPHGLRPLEPKPMPAGSWRETRAGDLAWATHYLFPWMVSRIRPRADEAPLTAKRPEPGPVSGSAAGPVSGSGSTAPDPAAGIPHP